MFENAVDCEITFGMYIVLAVCDSILRNRNA